MVSSSSAGAKAHAAPRKTAVYTYHEIDDRDECNVFMSLAACIIGFAAGLVIHMYPVYLPTVLSDSFIFKDFIYYKLVISVLCVGLLCNSLFSICRKGITRSWSGNGIFTGLAGAFVLGSGMALCRSDPMLLFIQLATFTPSSYWTALGALCGALSWGLIYDLIPKETLKFHPQYLDGLCKGKVVFAAIGIPLSLIAAGSLFAMEMLTNYEELELLKTDFFRPTLFYSPYFVGLCLALLQFPLTALFCKSLQGFCSWIATTAFPLNQLGKACNCNNKLPGYIRFTGSLSASWSILMGIGLFFGSFAAGAFRIKNVYWVEEGADMLPAFFGGFLMIMGAIYCGGDSFTLVSGITNLHIPAALNFGMMILGAWATTTLVKTYF